MVYAIYPDVSNPNMRVLLHNNNLWQMVFTKQANYAVLEMHNLV